MADAGLTATEIGPVGWLPQDAAAIRDLLDAHGLELVGGFVPFVLHTSDAPLDAAERAAALYAAAGATILNAAVVADLDWSTPFPLDEAEWRRIADNLARLEEAADRHGVTLAVHPHAGTLLEDARDVERLLELTTTGFCFDTGHALIGGADPVAFVREHADRIVHVHLKDVDAGLAARTRRGELGLMQAVQAGLFRPLGEGDAAIGDVVRALENHGYERWLVLEQDTAITGQEPPVGSGPMRDVVRSIEFLDTVAPTKEEVI
jgi:inosose dehydratase